MKKLAYLSFMSLLFLGCFPKTLVVEQIPCDRFKDCKETIKKVYMLQKPDKAPVEIEVTDEYIAWSKDVAVYHNVTGATSTHIQTNTIYFKDIDYLRVKDDNTSRFEIVFINKATKKENIIFLYDKDYAIQGYSAIKCMIEKAKNNPDNMY